MPSLSRAPLIGSAWNPPLWTILPLWALAGADGAYRLAAAAAFVQALRPATRARAFGVAQSGLCAVQGLGILVGGALAQAIGAPLAVGLADLVGRDRGHHARHELDAPARQADHGTAGRGGGSDA